MRIKSVALAVFLSTAGLLCALPAIAHMGSAVSNPIVVPPVAPTAAVQAIAPVHSCAEIKAFRDQLHKAINMALKYPHAMSRHPVMGVTSIAYEYFGGQVRNVRITMRSGDEMLDRIALAAVRNADYASILPRIDDEPIDDLVYIIFDNTGETSNESMKKKVREKQDAAEVCTH